ncbi:MAG: FUSC family protein, partial [Candidatus Eremiobacteraeota bacterium]|nr:FUSC family protein [Candidatus Eremiobacteraeota bacterium]
AFAVAAGHEAALAIGRIGASAAAVLSEIAAALAAARAPACDDAIWASFDAPLAELERARAEAHIERALGDAEALLGQLRSAWRAAAAPANADDGGDAVRASSSDAGVPRVPRTSALREALATLRANLSFKSGFAQHGIRLAVVLGLATFAAHVLPLHRGYWIAITVALVLRNDFSTTFTRGIARILGTLAGAVVASSVAFFVRPYPLTLLLLAVAFAFLGYVVFNVNYALFTLAVTGYVIFLLALGGLPEHVALVDRVGETLLGGTLALAAYALWPTWERALAPERLADMLEKQRRYASLVLNAYVDPARVAEATMRDAQRESWLARSTAETSVDRMLAEPVRPRAVSVRAALGILAASRRFGIATLSLQARLSRSQPVATKKLGELAAEIDTSFAILEDALRRHADPEPLPHLREAQIALVKRLRASAGETDLLAADTDLMVDSINTIAHVLHRLREGENADPAAGVHAGEASSVTP